MKKYDIRYNYGILKEGLKMKTTTIQNIFSSCEEHNIISLRIQETKKIIEMTKKALQRTPDDVALQMVLEQEEKELNELNKLY